MAIWRSHPAAGPGTSRAVPASAGSSIEQRTLAIGQDLLEKTRRQTPSAFTSRFWSDHLIAWALQDEGFKTQLFRFIDVFPSLKSPQAVQQHLQEYLKQPDIQLPRGLSLGLAAGQWLGGITSATIASQIQSMASHFIAGENLSQALPQLEARWREGIAFSVDLLGEACVSHAAAQVYRQRYLQLIQQLARDTLAWPDNSRLESDHLGPLPRASVSLKISALEGHVAPVDFPGSLDRLLAALAPLLEEATRANVLVYFDMEQHALKHLTLELFKKCCQQFRFPAGIALQTYLTSADEDLHDLIAWSRRVGRCVYVRLIKGAYWDYETLHAQLMNWPSPVWPHKSQTDACFERLTAHLIEQLPRTPDEPGVKLALGTHNIRSVAHALACLESAHLPASAIEFQVLRGMAEELKQTLVADGYRVREYVPIGQMIPGMAYLVRRLLENTSNESFLRAGNTRTLSDPQLLAAPIPPSISSMPAAPPRSQDKPFANEPHHDFSSPAQRQAFAQTLSSTSLSARPPDSTPPQADNAVAVACAAFSSWAHRPAQERCQMMIRAAALLRQRRDVLSSLMIREAHKTWAEADADVCEAIDFCEFYAREAQSLFTPQSLGDLAGEENTLHHEPRGVAAVISPWNFPLAICTGMTVAALVTGNPVLLKPSEQTPILAGQLCQALWEAGVPRQVLHYLPGPGEIIGAQLVRDPRVALVAFTGSAAVGLDILRAAAPSADPVVPIKHIICEMGGKNAIIVDSSADMDEAVLAVRHSAFSYAGQKCSACSRAIVLEDVHDLFVGRLIESTRSLVVGDPVNPATDLGPVIDAPAAEKIRRYIAIGRQEAHLALPDQSAPSQPSIPNLIQPHIFLDVPPGLCLAREEIFGPVLAVFRARDFAHALGIANDCPYKLTGGVFSRTPSHLSLAQREFQVGNLYLNRGITGAMVGRQPFGGFGLSGLGTQAGGHEYLLQFIYPRSIAENTLRRGFAPRQNQRI